MSWHFSRALVAEYLEASYKGTALSARSKLINIAAKYFYSGKTTGSLKPSRYGMTSELLTVQSGEILLTWFRAAFLARTSLAPAKDKESTESDRDFGTKWQELSVKFDPATRSLKILPCSEQGGSKSFSRILPFWGLMLSGRVYRRKIAKRPIKGIACGLLPTPTRMDHRDMTLQAVKTAETRGQQVRLAGFVKKWPTPQTNDHRPPCYSGSKRASEMLPTAAGGPLNPTWVEWLMGWPIGWTDLKPLAMDKFREWLEQHGRF
jgi:hypothetical protein